MKSPTFADVLIAAIALAAGTVLSAFQSPTFRKATEIVPVHVTVRTTGGEIVRGLTAKDFEVFDNGKRREIQTFSSDPLPVSVAILLDRSGSLDRHAYQVTRAGNAFLDHLLPGDRVSVHTLAADCQALTTDFKLVRTAIAAGPSDPGSPIWAGLDRTVSLFPDTTSRRAVLLVTDGQNDTAEGLLRQTNSDIRPIGRCRYATPVTPFALTADGAARHIERDGALVYAIGISEGNLFRSTLGRIASRSGGRRYSGDNDNSDLSATFTEIADELHLQYLIGFPAAAPDGKAHEIDVRVKRSGMVVRARKSYFTGETSSVAPTAPAGATSDLASSLILSDKEIADALADTNPDRGRASCVLDQLPATRNGKALPPATVLLRSPRARIADAAREAAAKGSPFTAADVSSSEDLRLRVVEMSMVFEIPAFSPLTRMWVVSRESEPVGLPPRTIVELPDLRLIARFDAAAFAKFPIVPLDLVVKGAGEVRHCTIPVTAVRNVLGR